MLSDLYYLFGFGMITPMINQLFISIIAIFIKYRYKISSNYDKSITDNIMKHICSTFLYSSDSTITMKCNYPTGLVIGKWYISYIQTEPANSYNCNEPTFTIQLYSYYNILSTYPQSPLSIESPTLHTIDQSLTVYRKHETWVGSGYNSYHIPVNHTFNTDIQNTISNNIIHLMKLSKLNQFNYSAIVLITGKPGLGKSKIAHIVADKLNGRLCDDYELTSPGYCFNNLISVAEPSFQTPLVILIDEHDKNIERITSENINMAKLYKAPASNKDTYNKFFDYLNDYDNTLTILTSNQPYSWFMGKDPAFVRPGRIHIHIHIHPNNTIEQNILGSPLNTDIASKVNLYRFTNHKQD